MQLKNLTKCNNLYFEKVILLKNGRQFCELLESVCLLLSVKKR